MYPNLLITWLFTLTISFQSLWSQNIYEFRFPAYFHPQSGFQNDSFQRFSKLRGIKAELDWYDFKAGEKVGEIGVGDPYFPGAIAASGYNIIYYINEVDFALLKDLAYQLEHHPSFLNSETTFFTVLGSHSSCGLESASLDKIVIRNAFHHFEYQEKMLQSIRKSLKPGGKLFIKEKFEEACLLGCCPELMSEKDFLSTLIKGNFKLNNRTTMIDENGDLWHLFLYQKIN